MEKKNSCNILVHALNMMMMKMIPRSHSRSYWPGLSRVRVAPISNNFLWAGIVVVLRLIKEKKIKTFKTQALEQYLSFLTVLILNVSKQDIKIIKSLTPASCNA